MKSVDTNALRLGLPQQEPIPSHCGVSDVHRQSAFSADKSSSSGCDSTVPIATETLVDCFLLDSHPVNSIMATDRTTNHLLTHAMIPPSKRSSYPQPLVVVCLSPAQLHLVFHTSCFAEPRDQVNRASLEWEESSPHRYHTEI
jgi:hypothetical protein